MQLSDRIGRRIRLQDVHILMAVVQAGSMAKAARHLNTSQPNISKSIADLERALGVRLLDRHRQGVEPTDYGRALLSGGAAVFDELRQISSFSPIRRLVRSESVQTQLWLLALHLLSSIGCADAIRGLRFIS